MESTIAHKAGEELSGRGSGVFRICNRSESRYWVRGQLGMEVGYSYIRGLSSRAKPSKRLLEPVFVGQNSQRFSVMFVLEHGMAWRDIGAGKRWLKCEVLVAMYVYSTFLHGVPDKILGYFHTG